MRKKKGAGGERDDSNDATSMIYGDGSSLFKSYVIPKRASQELEGPLRILSPIKGGTP